MSETIYDFVIVGAGMAGASLAAELAPHSRVIVIEAEDTPGYHATGRSAAFWEECYGGPKIVPLTRASGAYLREHGFLRQRGALYIGRQQDKNKLDQFAQTFSDAGVNLERLDHGAMAGKIPRLRDGWTQAVWQAACSDIDVAGLHGHYLGKLAKEGVQIRLRAGLKRASFADGVWKVVCKNGSTVKGGMLINAAGAWADEVAKSCNIQPIGIEPKRRTVAQIRVAPEAGDGLPLVLDINGGFYFKSESGRLWLSPHDETPSAPCDAAAEELDIARAIHRFNEVTDWQIENVERRWAGLRSFTPDRLPIYGLDLRQPAFAWFAGQGGFGIQTAPAAARFMAQKLLGLSPETMTANLCKASYDPQRFG